MKQGLGGSGVGGSYRKPAEWEIRKNIVNKDPDRNHVVGRPWLNLVFWACSLGRRDEQVAQGLGLPFVQSGRLSLHNKTSRGGETAFHFQSDANRL